MLASSRSKDVDRDAIIDLFWESFYDQIDASIVRDKKSNSTPYHNAVIKLLNSSKPSNGESLSNDGLWILQNQIEELTMSFDEESVFKSIPSTVGLLISKEKITATCK